MTGIEIQFYHGEKTQNIHNLFKRHISSHEALWVSVHLLNKRWWIAHAAVSCTTGTKISLLNDRYDLLIFFHPQSWRRPLPPSPPTHYWECLCLRRDSDIRWLIWLAHWLLSDFGSMTLMTRQQHRATKKERGEMNTEHGCFGRLAGRAAGRINQSTVRT